MKRTFKLGLAMLLFVMAASCSDDVGDDGDADRSADDPAAFSIDGNEATMHGVIDSGTPGAVRDLLADHPEVTTIVMDKVPGSDDDDANLEAAELIRDAGLNTHLNSNGEVASGGVDFFLAGVERSYDDGAKFGVHSWATGDGTEGKDLSKDDPEHDKYLDYYDAVGVAEDFYWFTLEAAPADDIHFMSSAELEEFGFATR